MKVTTISELAQLEPGDSIRCVKGTIKSVLKWRDGNNDYGPWSVQTIVLSDGKVEFKAKVWNRDELQRSLQGKEVYIQAGEGKKKEPIGLGIEENTHNNKTESLLVIRQEASIDLPDGQAQAQAQAQAPAPEERAQPQSQTSTGDSEWEQTTQHRPSPEGNQDGVKEAKRHAMKVANLAILGYQAANIAADKIKEKTGNQVTEGQLQSIASTIIIQLERDRMHHNMPSTPLA